MCVNETALAPPTGPGWRSEDRMERVLRMGGGGCVMVPEAVGSWSDRACAEESIGCRVLGGTDRGCVTISAIGAFSTRVLV